MAKKCFGQIPLALSSRKYGNYAERHKCANCNNRYNCIYVSAVSNGVLEKEEIKTLIHEVKLDYAHQCFFEKLDGNFLEEINKSEHKIVKNFFVDLMKKDYKEMKNVIEGIKNIAAEFGIDLESEEI